MINLSKIFSKFVFSNKDKKTEGYTSIDIISGKKCADCDAIFGVVKLDNVYASIIKLYPSGTIDKMLKNEKIQVNYIRTSLVEVGSEVRYKYKEIGAFSCWPNLTQLAHEDAFRIDHQPLAKVEVIPPAEPELPAKFVLLDQEVLKNALIHYEEENIRKYLRYKLQNISVQEKRLISINIAGFELAFNVLKTIPDGVVTIKPDTDLSFVLMEVEDGETYFKIVPPLPPEISKNEKT